MEIEETTPLVHEVTSNEARGPETLIEQLRAKRQELAESKETYLQVIGYGELGLQAKHRLMDRPEVEKIGRKVAGEVKDRSERNMRILLDQIIMSTSGFYIQPAGEEQPHPLLDDRNGDEPVLRWDQLAEYLGWQPNGSARSALYFVFGDNEFAIGQYGISLNRWMGNTGLKVDDEFLGEGM